MFGDSLGAFVKVAFQLKILLWLLLAIGSDSIKQVILLLIQLKPNTSGQSYKASTIIIYDSRVVPDWKIPHITTLES